MTRRLILIRHAKSGRRAGVEDHERPLSDRGHAAAARIGRWLRAEAPRPDEVIVSDAVRTQQTWQDIAAVLPDAPPPRLEPRLYHAGSDDILELLGAASGATVVIVGHNPGIGVMASEILRRPPDHPRFADFPTGATLVVRLPAPSWQEIRPYTGIAEKFVVPSDLG